MNGVTSAQFISAGIHFLSQMRLQAAVGAGDRGAFEFEFGNVQQDVCR